MTVPLRSGLAAAGRRLDRTIRAQGQGSTVCGDRTVTPARRKCGEVALQSYLHTYGVAATRHAAHAATPRTPPPPLADTIVRGPYEKEDGGEKTTMQNTYYAKRGLRSS